ncbi:hypothetical protein GW932_00270 [archaeon]|nr:hypothetical protein [archaeon]
MKKINYFYIFLFVIGLFLLLLYSSNDSEDENVSEKYNFLEGTNDYSQLENFVNITIYDTITNCSLDGKLFVNGIFVDYVVQGTYELYEDEIINSNNIQNISILGNTNNCFGNNSNLPYYVEWDVFDLFDYMNYELIVDLNPRWPDNPKSMQGFVRPEEVADRYSKINIDEENTVLENLEKIFAYGYMNYVSDKNRFGEDEYWQTPSDFIRNKGGDCEDWAIYMLSLIQRYDSELDCYLAVWYTHVNVLCSINKTFIILDQEKVRKNLVLDEDISLQENQIKVRTWRNDYFETYGIRPDERVLFYLINEKEIIEFENGQEDFVEWVLRKGEIIK